MDTALHARDTSKETPPDPGKPKSEPGAPTKDKGPKIRCPKCRWEPRKFDRWMCVCGHSWNTFDTRGQCPACSYTWPVTQCLGCQEYSEHELWYGE